LRVFEIIEKAQIDSRVLGGTGGPVNIYLADNNVYYFTPNATGNWTLNFLGDSTKTPATGLFLGGTDGFLNVGESMTVAIVTKQGATAFYNNVITIDNQTVTPYYYGGENINTGNAGTVSEASIDVYTYVIIRNASGGTIDQQFTVLYSQSQYTR
jgi:hypothetical protein